MIGGQTALALRVLLALFSSKMSSSANRPFGDEVVLWTVKDVPHLQLGYFQRLSEVCCSCLQFRAARKAAEDIGAQIVLGDRPIEITVCSTYT